MAGRAAAVSGPVAIVGLACRFPGGADTPARFWEALIEGRAAYGDIPADRFDIDALYDPDPAVPGRISTRQGAFIELPVGLDADFFGISPREARRLDPQQRLLLELAWEALEDAGVPPETLARGGAGVFAGISAQDYAGREYGSGGLAAIDGYTATGMALSVAANRISYLLDLRGPSLAIDTACSSALSAVHLACRSLAVGECEIALACGVNILLAPEIWVAFCRAGLLSRDGRCRPFDRDASGFARGEGGGCVVLRPLAAALSAGDRIHAVIRASSVNQDGRTTGISVPNPDAQETLIRSTLAAAGAVPADLGYVEAHGTGTVVGDRVEALALGRILAGRGEQGEMFPVGSVKGNIGHLEAAAGMAGLLKAVLMLHHGVIPPTANHAVPSPAIPWHDLGLRVPIAPETWHAGPAPRLAGVSSFGFGGANAHVLVEEAPPMAPPSPDDDRPRLAVVSARSPEALDHLAVAWADRLASAAAPSLRDACHTMAVRRSHHRHRLALVGATAAELTAQLRRGADAGAGVVVGTPAATGPGRLAFVFSGMGPQRVGMGMELFAGEPVYRRALADCDRRLREISGWSLLEALAGETPDGLARADRAQAAGVAVQIALAALWRAWGVEPDVVVGHSGGEIAAAHVAGALSLDDALLVAHHRGRLQQRAAGTGGMLAVGLGAVEAAGLIDGEADSVVVAAVNSPAAVTLSGTRDALAAIAARCDERGVFARPVPVDVPYHGPQLDGLRDELLSALAGVSPRVPALPLISTVTGEPAAAGAFDATYWWRNVRQPVLLAAALERLLAARLGGLLEIGPHPVLAAALRECVDAAGSHSTMILPTLRRGEDERATMLRSLGALHVAGWPVDIDAANGAGVLLDGPTYPWQRERFWIDRPLRASAEAASAGGAGSAARLPGRRLRTAQPTWEVDLSGTAFSYLADHVIGDAAILPGAAIVAIALGVARDLRGDGPLCVERIEFVRMLQLGGSDGPIVQCRAEADGPGVVIEAAEDDEGWSRVASARIGVPRPALPKVDLDELRDRCREAVSAEEFYIGAHRRRLRFGPAFRGLVELWRGRREGLGRIVAPPGLALDGAEAHPALLDAAFQAVGAALEHPPGGADARLVPVGIDRVVLYAPLPADTLVHAKLRDEELVADIVILTPLGDPVAAVDGLRLRPAGGERPQAASGWLYREVWRPLPPPPPSARQPLVPAAVAAQLDAPTGAYDPYYTELEPELNALAADHARTGLRELAATPAISGELRARHLAAVRAMALGAPPSAGVDELLVRFPEYDAPIRLVEESGRRVAATLRGEDDAREWLLTGEWRDVLAAVFADPPVFAVANAQAARAVATAARLAGPIRVLEVGAGTGATTLAVLERAADALGVYRVTDVSPAFVRRLRERFDGPGREFGELDVERPAPELAGAFDVVVAANVVHGTPELRATLRALRGLLAPGGMLVLQEGIRPNPWLDLVFGQFEGWWRARDGRDGALATRGAWREALEEAGFVGMASIADRPRTGGEPAQEVFLAANPVQRRRGGGTGRRWLVLGGGDVGAHLAAGLERRGESAAVSDDLPGDGIEEVDGIVHLRSLDLLNGAPSSADELMASQQASCGSLAEVARAVDGHPGICEVAVVTAGVQALDGGAVPRALARAPVWGMARVLRSERPDLRVHLVDLGADAPEADVEALATELAARPWPGRDGDLVLRDGRAHIRRLVRAPLDADVSEPTSVLPADQGFRLEVGSPGSLASLSLRRCPTNRPGPGEVEVRVRAAAVNFKDVLIALGLLRGVGADPYGIGFECAGTVTACGEGVEHVRPGDAVIAIAFEGGAFAPRLVTRGELVVRAPCGSTPEEAATLPGTFGTAVLAVRDVARVAPGERVLIHAAAGGVGLAALQLALAAGAEVLATASTPEKRDHLLRAGADHVMDSRSLAFVDEVLECTGGEGVDVVLNSLAGEAIDRGVELLRPYGRFVELGRRDIERDAALHLLPFRRGLTFSSVSFDTYCRDRAPAVGALLDDVVSDVERGVLAPLPHTVFDLAEAEDAFRLMSSAGHIGRIVLAVEQPAYVVHGTAGHAVRPDGTYLIAGGLGGLGLSLARRLAAHGARHLVLLGRSGAPAPQDAAALEALRATGAQIEVARCDIAREDELACLLEGVRASMPPLRGVVQAAMVIGDASLARVDADSLGRVLAPKVAGTWNLHVLTRDDPLDLFVLLSSIATDLGNPGQGSYAAANAFLDVLAADRRACGLPALCLGLGAIADVGHVARHPALVSSLSRVGVEAIRSDDVWETLDALLAAGSDRRIVASVDWESWLRGTGDTLRSSLPLDVAQSPTDGSAEPVRDLAAELLAFPAAERRAALERHVIDRAARVLDAPAERLDPDRSLVGFGLDSLMAVELIAALHRETGVRVALADVLRGISLRELSLAVDRGLEAAAL